jgi:hypothetical protein
MPAAEASYFDFLMKHRHSRRTRVPFAQAVGVTPDLTRVVRAQDTAALLPTDRLTPAAA